MADEIPDDVMRVADGIAADLPSRVTGTTRGFAANVIGRAILAERKRHEAAYQAVADSNRYLRDVAAPVGPQHAFWDVIAHNEAILAGQP